MCSKYLKHPQRVQMEISHRVGGRSQRVWNDLTSPIRLNIGCGMDFRPDYVGVDQNPQPYDIKHDLTDPFPLGDNTVSAIITEDTLEHLKEEDIVPLLNECHRILESGARMRVGVPDYGSPAKAEKLERGFDPDYPDHSFLPTYNQFLALVKKSDFHDWSFFHYWDDGVFHYKPMDHSCGTIKRAVDRKRHTKNQFLESSLCVDLFA